jgi:hypothetical protein
LSHAQGEEIQIFAAGDLTVNEQRIVVEFHETIAARAGSLGLMA